jgi:hypothetical protein
MLEKKPASAGFLKCKPLDTFKYHGDALTTTDTHGDERVFAASPL